MLEVEQLIAASFDLDGVFFKRTPAQLAVLNPLSYGKILVPGNPILSEHRVVVPSTPEDLRSKDFKRHDGRELIEGMALFIRQLKVDAIFGNTGRHNRQAWVDMTWSGLDQGGVKPYFKDIFFKPEDWSSDEGKYWAIKEMKAMGYRVIHFDDNARTIRRLAPHFPSDQFVVVEDWTSSLLYPKRLMERQPNVARISVEKDGTPKIKFMHPDFGALPLAA